MAKCTRHSFASWFPVAMANTARQLAPALALVAVLLLGSLACTVPVKQWSLLQRQFDPAAVSQILRQVSQTQEHVLKTQAQLFRTTANSPAGRAAAHNQQLLTKDLPYRLSGWTTPGTASQQGTTQRPYNDSPNRLSGFTQPGMTSGGASPWSGQGVSASGPARLHGYSTGQISNGGASPWSGHGAPASGQPSLGGGWKPQVKKSKARRAAATDFSTEEGRDERRRISLRLKGKSAEKRAAQQELRRVVGARPVEKLNIVVEKAKPVKV